MSLAVVAGLALLVIGALVGLPRWREHRRRAWAGRPFPPDWRAILRRRVPLYRRLPVPLQERLRRHVQVFLAEKQIVGCAGLEVTDEMRVTVAAHAALLYLHRPGPLYPDLHRVLIYPSAFVVDRVHPQPGGVLREERQVLSGESWSRGQVILSWPDVREGARVVDDGHNVALHEFAHQLDQETGTANGAPRMAGTALRGRWAEVMSAEFAAFKLRLQQQAWAHARGAPEEAGPQELINAYGATAPAEFFAVVTEVFFEQAGELALRHPTLFVVVRDFYGVDPRDWADDAG